MKKLERPSLVSIQEAADYLRVGRTTVYKVLKQRGIPGAFKVGSRWRIDLEELERFLETRPPK